MHSLQLNHSLRAFLSIGLLSIISIGCSADQVQDRPEKSPYVVLVSIDGFRHDYATKFGATNLLDFAKEGTAAESLIPCYPTKTFPNHHSIMTGLYPDHHGIIDNYFIDNTSGEYFSLRSKDPNNGRWFGGKPLWQLAQENGLKAATYFWVGSDMNINGVSPDYFFKYNETTPNTTRVEQVLDWLQLPEEERPHFIALYFSSVDSTGHVFGPDAVQTKEAVLKIDERIGQLNEGIKNIDLPVNIIIVSDHGMTQIDHEKLIDLRPQLSAYDLQYIPRDALLFLNSVDSTKTLEIYNTLKQHEGEQYKVYKKAEVPEHLHFGTNPRIGDLVLIPNAPYTFTFTDNGTSNNGTHGFDPGEDQNMHGIFYARGPNIKANATVPAFENIHIYPLVADILQLNYDAESIDGQLEKAVEILSAK